MSGFSGFAMLQSALVPYFPPNIPPVYVTGSVDMRIQISNFPDTFQEASLSFLLDGNVIQTISMNDTRFTEEPSYFHFEIERTLIQEMNFTMFFQYDPQTDGLTSSVFIDWIKILIRPS